MINRIGLWATAAATGVLALSTAALAADMPVKAPPRTAAAAVYSWTGFYAGIHGGYGWGDADYAFPVTNIFTSIFRPLAQGSINACLVAFSVAIWDTTNRSAI